MDKGSLSRVPFSLEHVVTRTRIPASVCPDNAKLFARYASLAKLVNEKADVSSFLEPFRRDYCLKIGLVAEAMQDYKTALAVYETPAKGSSWMSTYLSWFLHSGDLEQLMAITVPEEIRYFARMQRHHNRECRPLYEKVHRFAHRSHQHLAAAEIMLEIHDFHRMHNDLSLYSRTAPRIRGWSPTNEEVKLVVKMARIAKKHGYEGFADIYRMAIQLLQRNKWYGSAGRVAMEIRDYALAFSFFQKEGSYLRALNLSSQLGLSARLQCALQKKALVQRYYLELEAYDGMNRPKTTAAALADRFGMQKVLLEMYMRDFRLHNAKELAAKEGQDLDYILALRQHQDQFRQLTVPELRRLSLSLGEKHAYPVELLLEILALPRERIEKVVDLLEVGMNVYRAEQEPVIRLRREFPAAFEGSAQFSRRDALHVVLMEYWIRPGQNLWSEFGVRDLVEFGDVKRSLEELAQAGSLLSSAAFGRFLGVDYSSFSMPVQRRLRKLDPEQRLAVSLYIEYLRSLKEQSG